MRAVWLGSRMSFPGPPPRHRLALWSGAVTEAALDVLYPRLCWICEEPLGPSAPRTGVAAWFCAGCAAELTPVEPPYCSVCGEPFDGAMTEAFRCWNCEGRRLAF